MRLMINLNIFHKQESPTNIFFHQKNRPANCRREDLQRFKLINTHSNNFQRKWNHFGGTSWVNVVDENWCFTFIKTVISWPAFCQVRSFFSTVVSIQTKCFHFLLSPCWPKSSLGGPQFFLIFLVRCKDSNTKGKQLRYQSISRACYIFLQLDSPMIHMPYRNL